MKQIILLRHAKAVSQEEDLPDKKRSLQKKGRSQAESVAIRVKKSGIVPQLIISSPANRAIETAGIFAGVFGYSADNVEINETLYGELDENSFFEIVSGFKPDKASVMIVGHDPSMSGTAKLLAGFSESLPTSGIVVINFNVDAWADIRGKKGELVLFDYPKKDEDTYEAMESDISGRVFGAFFPLLERIDEKAAEKCKDKLTRWSSRIAETFVDEIKAIDKKK